MNRKIFVTILLVLSFLFAACGSKNKKDSYGGLKDIEIMIDWVPVAEYYGFFYAKHSGIFKKYGYNVEILTGSGASNVAVQVGAGNVAIGTTTSDNILRQYVRGGRYAAVRPLLSFNPSSVITLKKNHIDDISDLKGKTLGVNIQASPYVQWQFLLKRDRNTPLHEMEVKEYNIEWGGAPQLSEGRVDAFLGYTTNQAVDAELLEKDVCEIFLGDLGVVSYGVVLAFASSDILQKEKIDKNDVERIYQAVKEGYDRGFSDIPNAIRYMKMQDGDPMLDEEKLRLAIQKIGKLNKTIVYAPKKLDNWVKEDGITSQNRDSVLRLYSTVLWE